ncbi:MAG: hypothetical protein Q8S96_20860, partial [Hydrogenophaga sp.]|uniref:hypothetical protein n=1 Tax=Hydrogenophaga sp. TaxID=1904254 RepID=UPI002734B00F
MGVAFVGGVGWTLTEDQVEETDEVPADNRSRYESCWVVWVLRHSVWNLTNKVERFYREVR